MDAPDLLPNYSPDSDPNSCGDISSVAKNEDLAELQEQVMANFQKPNVPNVNVPEKIILCLDICHNNFKSMYHFSDGTSFSPINMMKRVLDFFVHSKNAINKRTEFALVLLKESEACWMQNFTSNLKEIINAIDHINPEECNAETFDLTKLFEAIKEKVDIPEYKDGECIQPPPHVVRMIVLYGRSNCVPVIPQDDPYLNFLKRQLYFYMDILLAHEEDCPQYKCVEIYDALQDLDNGYSYVYEVLRNATKIHDSIAKLLAHPLQRPLQKNTDYSFGSRY